MLRCTKTLLLTLFLVLFVAVGWGQAASKTFSVQSGWNLMNLPIQPVDSSVANVLLGLDYASAWKWKASDANWAVYLTGQDTQDYADSKGFGVLSYLNAGEGFWINVNDGNSADLSVTGTYPTDATFNMAESWNLVGLKSGSSMTVAEYLADLPSGMSAVSLWAWDAQDGSWMTFLPGETTTELASYLNSKGFSKLSTIAPSQGLWVNTSAEGTVDQTPPQVGKLYKTTGENTYVPLPFADVYRNENKIGQTDSNGNFELPADLQSDDVITVGSGDQYTISASKLTGGAMYLFAEDQDENKVTLSATPEGEEKALPKTVTSSNGKASITIFNMELTSAITVAVTPYKDALSLPSLATIKQVSVNSTETLEESIILGGADVSFVDSLTNSVSLVDVGFSGEVLSRCSNFFGDNDGKEIYEYMGSDDASKAIGSLHIVYYADGQWKYAGKATLNVETGQAKPGADQEAVASDMTFSLSGPTPDKMDGLYPFAFLFKQEYLQGSFQVNLSNGGIKYWQQQGDDTVEVIETNGTEGKGVVVDEDYQDPVENVMVTTDSSDGLSTSNGAGTATISYVLPPDDPTIGLILKKDGYFDNTSVYVNVLEQETVDVSMLERPATAAVGGQIYDTETNAGIPESKVTLKNPIVLDKVADNGTVIQVGLDGNATYTWVIKKEGSEDWITLLEGKGENEISRTEIKTKLIDNYSSLSADEKAAVGANPIGTYEVKVTVVHPFSNIDYKETATGYLNITVDMAELESTASLSQGFPAAVSVFGGKDVGFYYATAWLGTDTWEWKSSIRFWDGVSDQNADESWGQVIFDSETTASTDPLYSFTDTVNLVQKHYLQLLQPVPADLEGNGTTTYLEDGFTVYISLNVTVPAVYSGVFGDTVHSYSQYDVKSDDPLATLSIGKLQMTPNTTMAFEAKQLTDENGDYLFSFLDPDLSGLLGLYAAKAEYYPNNLFLTEAEYPLEAGWVTTADLGLDPVAADVPEETTNDWVETFEEANATDTPPSFETDNGNWTVDGDDQPVQWQALQNPESVGPATDIGIANYPVPADVTGAEPYLLPAFEGNWVAWFGNVQSATFSDSGENTSNGAKQGTLTSPVIDLANFSFATLGLATWWEVESVDVAKWQFDQMKVLITVVADEYPVTVDDYTFESADDWKIVAFMNPESEVSVQSANVNYSSGGNDAVPVWTSVSSNLNPFVGKKVKLRFDFHSNDSLYNGFRGWAVDEIKVKNADSNQDFSLQQPNYWWKKPVRSAE